jgi:hypothetical protein
MRSAVLAAADAFDADDLRPQVAEQRGTVGTCEVATEVEHADALEHRHWDTLKMSSKERTWISV